MVSEQELAEWEATLKDWPGVAYSDYVTDVLRYVEYTEDVIPRLIAEVRRLQEQNNG